MDTTNTSNNSERNELLRQLAECRKSREERTVQFKNLLVQAKAMTGNLRRNFEGMVNLLADMLSQASPQMGGHAKRVAALSRSIAFSLHLNPDRRRLIYYAASLHDLSLIGREDEWRNGSGPHWSLHPVQSANQIATVENLSRIAHVIRCHHEHMDGSGFPDGITGQEIPPESRILAAVTAYDRQLRLEGKASTDLISQMRDSDHFDPVVLDQLEKISGNAEQQRQKGDRLVAASDLVPGMILADDLLLQSGLVLYPHETIINEENLTRIRSFDAMLVKERLIRVFNR